MIPISLQLHGVSDALVHIRKLKSTCVAQPLAFACIGCNINRRIAEKRKSTCPTFGLCWTLMLLTFRLLNSAAESGAASWFKLLTGTALIQIGAPLVHASLNRAQLQWKWIYLSRECAETGVTLPTGPMATHLGTSRYT